VTANDSVWLEDSVVEINDYFLTQGWSDGLPVVPPTRELVAAAVDAAGGDAEREVAVLPPLFGVATVGKIAVNAVMAGCRPEYMPAVVAAVEAVADPAFNLVGVQATTHPAGPLLIVNGPARAALGVNAGAGAFGPGHRANATIGRALRLILINVGGARPGEIDKATLGHPGKYTYCIAENEEANPWGPLHVDRGHDAGTSTITAIPAEAPHNVNDPYAHDGAGVLRTIAGALAQTGANNNWYDGEVVLVLCPEHARLIADDGFDRRDVQEFLYEHAVTPMSRWSEGSQEVRFRRKWPDLYRDADPAATQIPIVRRPEGIVIVVAGGAGKHSMHVPTVGSGHPVTRSFAA
jgi:hypothetical protein